MKVIYNQQDFDRFFNLKQEVHHHNTWAPISLYHFIYRRSILEIGNLLHLTVPSNVKVMTTISNAKSKMY